MSDPAGAGDPLDRARVVRPGEELDAAKLEPLLAAWIPDWPRGEELVIEQFTSGYSNLTYLLRAGEKEWVLRRPPIGVKISTAHDMAREHRVLTGLAKVFAKAPRPLFLCEDPAALGAPFYVMERVRGVILRKGLPPGVELSPSGMRRLSEAALDTLVEIHGVDLAAAGLSDLGKPEGYVARQVTGWTKRWREARTDDVPAIDRLAAWLGEQLPRDAGATLVHNDYKYDNLVLDPADLSHVRAVLDWEMATVGDPLMDLGTTLGYWVMADDPPAWRAQAFVPTHLSGNLTRDELLERYARATGREVSNAVFYFAFALLKLAVIGQQIYARYRRGLSTDERFATLLDSVRGCGALALRAIERGRIGALDD